MKQDQRNTVDCRASYALFQENFETIPYLEEEQTLQNDETDVVEEDHQNVVLYTESELESIV
ncbi:hypothetical protein, partial [Acetobacter sp.]|uniref:hypothetical protein n=1 Tax=Acetobacter sp. TaxID=440 RepID=UPI0039EBDC72